MQYFIEQECNRERERPIGLATTGWFRCVWNNGKYKMKTVGEEMKRKHCRKENCTRISVH
jgi:hypothetical protein